MKVKEIIAYLESLAPLVTQESYDNSGLIVGDRDKEIDSVLISLDCTEAIIEEAIEKGAGMVIAHHPIVFKGLKSFTGKTYVERTVIQAIKNDIAIYAIHTNLDHYIGGVNAEICERIGLKNIKVLAPLAGHLNKLSVFVPETNLEIVRSAAFNAGAGAIGNYTECSFSVKGVGTFKPEKDADPYTGKIGERSEDEEVKVEFLVDQFNAVSVVDAIRTVHPYEEMAYELYPINNVNQDLGAGMIGELEQPEEVMSFLKRVKALFNAGVVRYTDASFKTVQRVAVCGGSGSFLLKNAIQARADIFITGDFKYHEFFDAEGRIVIADIGHYESEQFTSNRLEALIKEKFPKFAVHLTRNNTNPINYL